MNISKNSRFITLLFIIFFTFGSQSVFSAESDNIVVSVKSNLYEDKGYESACVGVQIGMLLLNKGANVTLFTSLDGVELANATTLSYIDAVNKYVNKAECVTKEGPKPLTALVNGFTSSGGSILVCPLCWAARFTGDSSATLVEGATIGNPDTLADMFLNADKVIDF